MNEKQSNDLDSEISDDEEEVEASLGRAVKAQTIHATRHQRSINAMPSILCSRRRERS